MSPKSSISDCVPNLVNTLEGWSLQPKGLTSSVNGENCKMLQFPSRL